MAGGHGQGQARDNRTCSNQEPLMSSATPSYDHLHRAFERLHHLQHAYDMLSWDAAAMMPAGGQPARAAALAELA
mgnify:CR=1 FL=1